jgi:hypothetical protein
MFEFVVAATRRETGIKKLSEAEVLRKLIRDRATELGWSEPGVEAKLRPSTTQPSRIRRADQKGER